MDLENRIKIVKYSNALLKNKLMLERVNCNHIEVILGLFDSKCNNQNSMCLFCGTKHFKPHTPVINAAFYKSEIYGNGSIEQARICRLKDIQELWLQYVTENPRLTESQLLEKIREAIKEDEEKNKQFQKRIKREV